MVINSYHTHFLGFQFLNGAERGQQRPATRSCNEPNNCRRTHAEHTQHLPGNTNEDTSKEASRMAELCFYHSAEIRDGWIQRRPISLYHFTVRHVHTLQGCFFFSTRGSWVWEDLLPYMTSRSAWFRSSHMHPTWLSGRTAVALDDSLAEPRKPGNDVPNMIRLHSLRTVRYFMC